MPAIQSPAKVLVTGASGFIACWLVKTLLQKGYTVVGTVRSTSKGEYLKNLFKEFGDKFSYVIVEDIEKEGAFDEAVKGVDVVEHTASPFHFRADDPQELIGPAVKGTVGVLESIKKNNPNVKRVVITSSVASIMHDKTPKEFDESDWNITSPKIVEEKGKDAPGGDKYRTSKTLAERAAWEFIEKNKGSISFDLVTINPPFVIGPIIQDVSSVDAINTSVASFYHHTTKKESKTNEELAAPIGSWVDVRDVALAHALALEVEAAGGQRFIVSSGNYSYQNVLDALHTPTTREDVPLGNPGAAKDLVYPIYHAEKAERVLGIKFKNLQESAHDTLSALRSRGFD